MKLIKKIKKALFFISLNIVWYVKPELATRMYSEFLVKHGADIDGMPNYLSAKIWFDGADYSNIKLGKEVTISSNVRLLTHDWSIYTVAKAHGYFTGEPVGIHRKISIGDYSFVGTGAILLPGVELGKGVLVGAGSVVRGKIPDHAIVVGNPAKIVGNTQDFVKKYIS
jgi:acetyltransferase-like isoleucine patch superfamily enzyme